MVHAGITESLLSILLRWLQYLWKIVCYWISIVIEVGLSLLGRMMATFTFTDSDSNNLIVDSWAGSFVGHFVDSSVFSIIVFCISVMMVALIVKWIIKLARG